MRRGSLLASKLRHKFCYVRGEASVGRTNMAQSQTFEATASGSETETASARWIQLFLGFIVMMTISSPQYVWTLFVPSFQKTTGSMLSEVQWTITFLIVLQTWLSPMQGFLIERLGTKVLIGLGAVMSGAGWIASSYITTIWGLFATYGLLCGIGTGIVYIGIIGLMVKWFPDRRGLATGVVAAGYGFGAILTTFPVDTMIRQAGYQHTLVVFGIILGVVGAAAALAIRMPTSADVLPPPPAMAARAGAAPGPMLRSRGFLV